MRTIRVRVKPNSRIRCLTEVDGTWVARVKSPPVDGKANRELIELVAEHFGVPRSRVSIRRGAGARFKSVQIED